MKQLDYKVLDPKMMPTSLSIFDSDFSGNAIVMRQLIGTLVKYNTSSRAVGNISERWQFNEKNNSWKFYFKQGLYTDKGVEINVRNYLNGFYKVFNEYIKKYDPPVFKYLVGYKNFKEGKTKTISGLKEIKGNILELNFTRKVSGVLEFLSMPYYGFLSENNFDMNNWKDPFQIDSSSGYVVNSWKNETLTLKKREYWKLNNSCMPDEIKVFSDQQMGTPKHPTIINVGNSTKEVDQNSFSDFFGIPSILTALILSTEKNQLLKNARVRKYIRDKIHHENQSIDLDAIGIFKTKTFYSTLAKNSNKLNPYQLEIPQELKRERKEITVGITSTKNSNIGIFFENLLTRVFENTAIKINWHYIDYSTPGQRERLLSNRHYDIRISSVNTGDYPINWVVDMMFCSTLGVSFPDYSGKICKLVKGYTESNIQKDDYRKVFEDIVSKDAVVIPIYHKAQRWVISNEIDPSSLEPTSSSI